VQRISSAKKYLLLFILLVSIFSACTKIDTTTLGRDLIPAVDNVNTFADTLLMEGDQGIYNDTFTRVIRSDLHVLGTISNDPLFGKTRADLYLQLKPSFYPYFYGITGDTIADVISPAVDARGTGFDSAVLCLSFRSFFGDTNVPQTLRVYVMDRNVQNFKDSSYLLSYQPDQTAGEQLIGSTTFLPNAVKTVTRFPGRVGDSISNQIRIKLDNSFLASLIGPGRDTSAAANGQFRNDSLFLANLPGFAIKADGMQGNGLFYISLDDKATRLEVHYKKIRNNVLDTTYSTLSFSTGISTRASAQATRLERERSGAEVLAAQPDALYIQTTPGTYANLFIPSLSTLSNRIVHRAEVVVQQIPSDDLLDQAMLPPAYLYLDLIDTSSSGEVRVKPVYFDLNPRVGYNPDNNIFFYPNGGIDFSYYGGFARLREADGKRQFYYTFNVSRHVQHMVTNGLLNFKFRLSAPVNLRYYGFNVAYRNQLADGRVKVGNGNHPRYKMFMRVVYSRI